LIPAPRQIVAAVTAASVLLCGIVCACGGSLPAMRDPSVAASAAAARPAEHGEHDAHCHGHHDDDRDSQDPHGQKPEPCHGGDHSCSHCQSAVNAVPDAGKNTADLNPLTYPAGLVLPAVFAMPCAAVGQIRWTAVGDLSPPPAPTLLRLHCALNT
jgi:hypothetical protein